MIDTTSNMPEVIYAGVYLKYGDLKETDGWNIHKHGTKYIRADTIQEWNLNMDAAPKDKRILVYADDSAYGGIKNEIICAASWGIYAGRECWTGFPLNSHYTVKAWQPLPKPPIGSE